MLSELYKKGKFKKMCTMYICKYYLKMYCIDDAAKMDHILNKLFINN